MDDSDFKNTKAEREKLCMKRIEIAENWTMKDLASALKDIKTTNQGIPTII